jgi:predicted transcriptional regulator
MRLDVPPDLEARLNRVAAETGRDATQLALDLLARSVEHEEWFRREVRNGQAAGHAGDCSTTIK